MFIENGFPQISGISVKNFSFFWLLQAGKIF